MSLYSKKTMEHFQNPQNVGEFGKNEKNIGTGIVGSPECGDVMRLQIKVDPESTIIEDVRFKTFGCVSAIAASSLIATKIKGLSISEALNIVNKDIADELALPAIKLHCSVLAEQAVKNAIIDYSRRKDNNDITADDATPHHNYIEQNDAHHPKRYHHNSTKNTHNTSSQCDRGRSCRITQCNHRATCSAAAAEGVVTPPSSTYNDIHITITPPAITKILNYISQQNNIYCGVRIGIHFNTGCSGAGYSFEYVKHQDINEADKQIKLNNNVILLIAEDAYSYLQGVLVDYVDNGINAGFVFHNPNAHTVCGCGQSFSIKK